MLSARERKTLPKLVVLAGPTASGKTDWSLRLAKKFSGEIISADSRQIYRKMDIGTAKAEGEWRLNGLRRTFFVEDIPHHLIDFLDPGRAFSVAEFRDKALKYAKLAAQHDRLPMVVGGTGLYISSLVDNFVIPRVPANPKLRQSLTGKTTKELMRLLERLDPQSARSIDMANKRRLVRALEVCILTGEPFSAQKLKGDPLFQILQIAPSVERSVLRGRIHDRVDAMVSRGLVAEIEALLKQGYGWNLPSMNGIGYRQFRPYFEGTATVETCTEALKRDTGRLARRQMTWFRRDDRIHWCATYEEAERLVEHFLSS